jgi:hypothetical protein
VELKTSAPVNAASSGDGHTIPDVASTSTQLQNSDEPKFAEEAIRPSPEEAACEPAFSDSTFVERDTTCSWSFSVGAMAFSVELKTPVAEAFAPANDAHLDLAAADVDTTTQDQPFWKNEPSGDTSAAARSRWASLAGAKASATGGGEPAFSDSTFVENEPSGEGDSDDGFFNQLNSQTKPIFAPPEAESRFPEWLYPRLLRPGLDGRRWPVQRPPRQEVVNRHSPFLEKRAER